MIVCRSNVEIDKIRNAGKIVAKALDLAGKTIRPGLTTLELDRLIEELINREKGRPAFKGYKGYPAATCISINEVVVHGIPNRRRLESGQLVSIDIGVEADGYFADAAMTFKVGSVDEKVNELIEVGKKALEVGISTARDGNYLFDISAGIQGVAEAAGFSVVRDYVGHGIGKQMHEEPQIPNYAQSSRGPRLNAGMVLALEPMINLGGHNVEVLDDGWTVVTKDRQLSVHFEHTIAITKNEPKILTTL